jgi:hypothetical protein
MGFFDVVWRIGMTETMELGDMHHVDSDGYVFVTDNARLGML